MNTFKDESELAIMSMHLFNLTYYIIHEAEINRNTKAIKERMEGEE